MKARFTNDSKGLHGFLKTWGYTSNVLMHPEMLDNCLKVEITASNGDLAGYIWAHWDPMDDECLYFHMCVKPYWRGKWFSPTLLIELKILARACGATALACHPYGDYKQAADRLLERIGFKRSPSGAWIGYL